jgi:energy-coupling factor transport system ATP-binding protein
MIHVDNISVTYGSQEVLRGVSLQCEPGQRVCICGANGSGKSTLLKTINALMPITSGQVRVDGLDPFDETHTRDVRTIVGYVQQRPDDQLVATSVLDDVAFGPENLGCPRDEILERCHEALDKVGLTGYEERAPHTLSGGQKQRLVIAGALAMKPRYLLFDEPTSQLDPQGRAEILDIMDELTASGVGIIHVTHDRDEIKRGDVIIEMDAGTNRAHEEPDQALTSTYAQDIESFEPILPIEPIADPSILKVQDGSVVYRLGEQIVEALSDMDLTVKQGELVIVKGRTGSGKSTLLKIMAGLLDPTKGAVTLDGVPIADNRNRGKVGLIFQDAESALFADTVRDDVAFGPRNFGATPLEAFAQADDALAAVGMDVAYFGSRSPFHLSGGEARRVAIAGILAFSPSFILADEPTAGLDPEGRQRVIKTLVEATARSGVVVVTHNPEQFERYMDQVISLD